MTAYYNENNAFAASWLRELIKANLIAQGDVDERSIKEVKAEDLKSYAQCHFFAGIGVWSYALKQAGWLDDRKVWTGSCPCQPFSAAGKKGGFNDARHLWPDWFRLIRECHPDPIFGEQVASKDGLAWFDLVSTDLEGEDYTVGAADLCAAGFGAPHIRQRLYFVGHSDNERSQRRGISRNSTNQRLARTTSLADSLDNASDSRRQGTGKYDGRPSLLSARSEQPSSSIQLADNAPIGRREECSNDGRIITGDRTERIAAGFESSGRVSELADSDGGNTGSEGLQRSGEYGQQSQDGSISRSAVNGFWSQADWIPCIDGKARPVEPGTFPLAHGVANRMGKLRGYGNALCAKVAKGFIEAYLEIEG